MNKNGKYIHYCWLGGNKLPRKLKKYMKTRKKYLQDYEIVEWNESNFDVNFCEFVKDAYENKKWAFVSDVARLYALYNYGGIYFDTDIEKIVGEEVILKGNWTTHKKYGVQFEFDTLELKEAEIFFFLTKIVKGVGKKFAHELLEKYTEEELVEILNEKEFYSGDVPPKVAFENTLFTVIEKRLNKL